MLPLFQRSLLIVHVVRELIWAHMESQSPDIVTFDILKKQVCDGVRKKPDAFTSQRLGFA